MMVVLINNMFYLRYRRMKNPLQQSRQGQKLEVSLVSNQNKTVSASYSEVVENIREPLF